MEPERTPHSLLLGATCLSARCTPRGARAYTSRPDTSLFLCPLEENEMKPPDSQDTPGGNLIKRHRRPSRGSHLPLVMSHLFRSKTALSGPRGTL